MEYLQYKKSTDSVWLDWPNGVNGDANKTITGYVLDSANLSASQKYEDFYIEWQIIDYAGNTTNYTQTIRITDNIGPTFVSVHSSQSEDSTGKTPEIDITAPTVTDNVSTNIVIEYKRENITNGIIIRNLSVDNIYEAIKKLIVFPRYRIKFQNLSLKNFYLEGDLWNRL